MLFQSTLKQIFKMVVHGKKSLMEHHPLQPAQALESPPPAALLRAWLEMRHTASCSYATPVYFAPTSPTGIGNKLMGLVMSFHIALLLGRQLVITDWPPYTLDTMHPLADVIRVSACQRLFEMDTTRPSVKKCSMTGCPIHTSSAFADGRTQEHWAHQARDSLELPGTWAHLDWLQWWRAISQYLLLPGKGLLRGLSDTLHGLQLLTSRPVPSGAPLAPLLETPAVRTDAYFARVTKQDDTFTGRMRRVVSWGGALPRPIIGVHVRIGDSCWDSKRGGCKYANSFGDVRAKLQAQGHSNGTVFLATDSDAVALDASRSPGSYFVIFLQEDRELGQQTHGYGHKEKDALLHLQLLDLGLLAQARRAMQLQEIEKDTAHHPPPTIHHPPPTTHHLPLVSLAGLCRSTSAQLGLQATSRTGGGLTCPPSQVRTSKVRTSKVRTSNSSPVKSAPLFLISDCSQLHHSPITAPHPTEHRAPSTTQHSPLTTHRSPLTSSPPTTHRSPLTAHGLPPTTHHPPLTIHRSPLTAHCSLLTTYHSPPTTYHSLLTAPLLRRARTQCGCPPQPVELWPLARRRPPRAQWRCDAGVSALARLPEPIMN